MAIRSASALRVTPPARYGTWSNMAGSVDSGPSIRAGAVQDARRRNLHSRIVTHIVTEVI